MTGTKPVSIPFVAHFKLYTGISPNTEEEIEHMANIPYYNVVGNIIYDMIYTRPDISHAVSVVSIYMANPAKEHWQVVKWILRYLKGTTDVGLMFDKTKIKDIVASFVNSDYVRDLDKKRSLTGYVFTCAGTAISWKATLQSVVALSTTEAEYMATTEGRVYGYRI